MYKIQFIVLLLFANMAKGQNSIDSCLYKKTYRKNQDYVMIKVQLKDSSKLYYLVGRNAAIFDYLSHIKEIEKEIKKDGYSHYMYAHAITGKPIYMKITRRVRKFLSFIPVDKILPSPECAIKYSGNMPILRSENCPTEHNFYEIILAILLQKKRIIFRDGAGEYIIQDCK